MLQSNQKIIRHKVGLLNLAEELGNVSKACQMMGLSRDTFYRYRDAVEEGGVEALLEKPRRVPNFKNRVDEETETAVVDYAVEYPAYGQVRVSNELRKLGVFVSASGVRSIWMRHDLANFKQRLKALEAKVANDGIVLTEAQVQALEKKKLDDEAWGEIETAHPGYRRARVRSLRHRHRRPDQRFRRHRRRHRATGSGDFGRYRRRPSGRGAGQAGVGGAAAPRRLALDDGPRRQPLVSDHAAVPPIRPRRLGPGVRSPESGADGTGRRQKNR